MGLRATFLPWPVLRRGRPLAVAGGLALAAESALTKFGWFYGGIASAADPKYTVLPQRERSAEARDGRP